MSRRRVVICLLLLRQALASEHLSWLEGSLQGLLVNAGYAEAFFKLLDKAFLKLPKPSLMDEASASARVQALLVRYADRTMRLQFVEVAGRPGRPWAMTAQGHGNRIVVNTAWPMGATEDDLHAVLAHEVSDDANDCIRFWLIEESALTKRHKENARNEIEMKADARAIDLLRREKRGLGVLPAMLSRYLPPGLASKTRISVARKVSQSSANTATPGVRSRDVPFDLPLSHGANHEVQF